MQARSFRLRFHRVIHMSNTIGTGQGQDIHSTLSEKEDRSLLSLLCAYPIYLVHSSMPWPPIPSQERRLTPAATIDSTHTQTAAPFHVPYFPSTAISRLPLPFPFPFRTARLSAILYIPVPKSPSKHRGVLAEARPNICRRKKMLETHLFPPIVSILASDDRFPWMCTMGLAYCSHTRPRSACVCARPSEPDVVVRKHAVRRLIPFNLP